jgi:hypothetical protein
MYVENRNNIPDYDHPFNVTIINDNSAMPRRPQIVPDKVNYLCVFVGGKGRDNKLIKKTNKADFIREFGEPNIIKYGQPILNAYASIIDAYSHAYCMRVMPPDACYSNLMVLAKYKLSDGSLDIKLVGEVESDLKNAEQFQSIFDQKRSDEEDEAGFRTIPLFAVRCLGRGIWGNSLRIRLTNVFRKRTIIDYRPYRLEILDIDQGNTIVESFDGCLYDYAVNANSLLLSDKMDGETNYSEKLSMMVNEEAFELLFEKYDLVCNNLGNANKLNNYREFDPIFGIMNNKTKIPYLNIDSSELALDRLDGISLEGGHDGMFANGVDLESVELENLYLQAFRGELDKNILSTRRTPVKFMLDANYPIAVKRQMVNLALTRYDALVYLDAGILTTHDEALIFGEDTADLNYRIVSKGYQHYQIRDPFNGKKVEVTYTYHLANQLAKHCETIGSHVPFTGEAYALLTGAVKNSILPVLEEYDEDKKEELYDLRLNYYEALGENIYARGTQVTAQSLDSDLSEEHNMLITLEIKDIAEKETIARRYNFAEPEDRQLFTEILTERTRRYKDIVRNINVLYSMTPEEEMRSVLHCYVEVTFKTIAKSSIVEININKRVQ